MHYLSHLMQLEISFARRQVDAAGLGLRYLNPMCAIIRAGHDFGPHKYKHRFLAFICKYIDFAVLAAFFRRVIDYEIEGRYLWRDIRNVIIY